MQKSLVIGSVVTLAALALPGGALVGTASAQTGLCSQPNQHCVAVTVGKDAVMRAYARAAPRRYDYAAGFHEDIYQALFDG